MTDKKASSITYYEIISTQFHFGARFTPKQDYIKIPLECAKELNLPIGVVYPGKRTDYNKQLIFPELKTENIRGLGYIRFLRQHRNDMMYCNARIWQSFIVPFFCKKNIFMAHQGQLPKGKIKQLIYRLLVKNFQYIRTNTPYESEQLIKIGVKKEKIVLIPLSVDYELFSRKITSAKEKALRKKYNINPKDKVIIHLSSARKLKNPYTIIDALTQILKKYDAKLIIVGLDLLDQEGGPNIKEYSKTKEVENNVIVTGLLSQEELAPIVKLGDIGVMSSDNEGQCLAAYEMSAAGMPICLSSIGSLTSVFGHSALFHKPTDSVKLAHNIEQYLRDKELARKHVSQNQKIVKTYCDYDTVKKQLKQLYLKALESE
jgi:glycosyltransferase involved in cell wall biosynthesis